MEINLGDQRLVGLTATYTPEQIQGLALTKRIDAFGQMAKLFQRPKLDDIEIATVQKRFEPFWFAAASARYAYDRRHSYRIDVAPEVRSITIAGTVMGGWAAIRRSSCSYAGSPAVSPYRCR